MPGRDSPRAAIGVTVRVSWGGCPAGQRDLMLPLELADYREAVARL